MASRKFEFSVWGRSAKKYGLGDEIAMKKDDESRAEAASRRLERLTGLKVVSMRLDSQQQRDGEAVANIFEVTLGRALYRRGLGGKRYSDGYSVEGEVWVCVPRS